MFHQSHDPTNVDRVYGPARLPPTSDAFLKLRESLSTEQFALFLEGDSEEGAYWLDEIADIVDGVAEHIPGFGPAIRAIARKLEHQPQQWVTAS